MVKIEPLQLQQPPTKLEFLEYLTQLGYFWVTSADLENSSYYLDWFERWESQYLNIFEKYFNGDWRKGKEIHKAVITQRLYQTSPDSTQA